MGRAGTGRRVEGIHAVLAAIDAGRVRSLLVERRRLESLGAVVDAAKDAGATVDVVDDVRDHAETAAPQGVVATCAPLPLADLIDLARAPGAAVLVLDHLEDPHNVGALARSAVAAGMTGLVVSTDRAAPLSAAAFKAAVGALERIPVAEVRSVADAIARLKKAGLWIVGLDAGGDQSLFGLELLTEPVAVVVGSEGAGLGRLVADRCDVVASIPMAATTESLNASVAGAMASFEVSRVRGGIAGAGR